MKREALTLLLLFLLAHPAAGSHREQMGKCRSYLGALARGEKLTAPQSARMKRDLWYYSPKESSGDMVRVPKGYGTVAKVLTGSRHIHDQLASISGVVHPSGKVTAHAAKKSGTITSSQNAWARSEMTKADDMKHTVGAGVSAGLPMQTLDGKSNLRIWSGRDAWCSLEEEDAESLAASYFESDGDSAVLADPASPVHADQMKLTVGAGVSAAPKSWSQCKPGGWSLGDIRQSINWAEIGEVDVESLCEDCLLDAGQPGIEQEIPPLEPQVPGRVVTYCPSIELLLEANSHLACENAAYQDANTELVSRLAACEMWQTHESWFEATDYSRNSSKHVISICDLVNVTDGCDSFDLAGRVSGAEPCSELSVTASVAGHCTRSYTPLGDVRKQAKTPGKCGPRQPEQSADGGCDKDLGTVTDFDDELPRDDPASPRDQCQEVPGDDNLLLIELQCRILDLEAVCGSSSCEKPRPSVCRTCTNSCCVPLAAYGLFLVLCCGAGTVQAVEQGASSTSLLASAALGVGPSKVSAFAVLCGCVLVLCDFNVSAAVGRTGNFLKDFATSGGCTIASFLAFLACCAAFGVLQSHAGALGATEEFD